jgi:signal transduction histidine kinase/ligand-binding sensor domain-containing protein
MTMRLQAVVKTYLIFMILLASSALALGSSQLADDYVRTDFTVEDGLPDSVVNAIVQTANGLLWVGTQSGLASFDGRDFTAIDLRTAGSPSQGAVHALLESAAGDLWVGTDAGLIVIPRPALDRFNPELVTFYHLGSGLSGEVDALLQARDGVIWAGTSQGLYRQQAGQFVEVIPALSINRIAQAFDGHLLLVTGQGFLEWDGRGIVRHPGLAASLGVHDDQIFQVFQDHSGTMWYGTNQGIVRRGGPRSAPLQPAQEAKTAAFRISEDEGHTVWIANGIGVYRVDGDQLETPATNLRPRFFYAARDGDLWVGTNGYGLVHLRRRVVRMFTAADGLPNDVAMAVLSAHDGRLWVGNNCGLAVFDGKHFKNYNEKDGLANSCVWSLAEDAKNNLWIGTYGGGLFRFRDDHFVQYSTGQGLVSPIVLQIVVAHDDSLWIATPDGISHLQDSRIRNYTVADGLSSNRVLSVYQDRDGNLWAATQRGLNRLQGERFIPFPANQTKDGPFSVGFSQDSLGNLYATASPKGISLIANNRLIIANEELKLRDMVESPQHDLWFSGNNGIIRTRRDDLISAVWNQNAPLDYRVFDRSDGMNSIQCSVGAPNLALAPDGKFWVATVKGLAMIDLALVDLGKSPQVTRKPKVFVGAITVGNHQEFPGEELNLPPGAHHVEIPLEAIDLASPEKVRLQYRLEGVDPAWVDADASRTAIYTDIPPGTHLLHIRASGSDGVWDRTGIVYNIRQRPYFYQTAWFQFIIITTVLLLLSAAYFLRVQQIVRQTRIRLAERERIARELHDTLLQGVLSASMQLDLAEDQLPEDSPTKPLLKRILQMMRQVIDEGRDALRGLRTGDADTGDLAVSFSRIGREYAIDEKIQYQVVAQSATRPLRPKIRDEVYRIGREAIVNAFVHAQAKSVEVAIEYASSYFRLLVRDDGCGIDDRVLEAGREGHWGLPGMRERAEGIGGQLTVRSGMGAGTEVELTIPGAVAFEEGSNGSFSHWLPWLSREKFEAPSGSGQKRG